MLVRRSDRGQICHQREVYGKTRLGAPLEVWLPADKKVTFLIVAGIHGDEPETSVVLSTALRSLPENELKSAVVLGANPDGLSRGTRANAEGVDLNRNFPAKNWTKEKVAHRWNDDEPRDVELSPGVTPASEPETKGLIELVERLKPSAIISMHCPLNCIDDPLETALGRWISHQTGLKLVTDVGYSTPGSFNSWALDKGLCMVTYELPHDSIESHRARHEATLLALLRGEQG